MDFWREKIGFLDRRQGKFLDTKNNVLELVLIKNRHISKTNQFFGKCSTFWKEFWIFEKIDNSSSS